MAGNVVIMDVEESVYSETRVQPFSEEKYQTSFPCDSF